MSRRIVLTGGLSGGHTFPLIAVARALREESKGESDIEFLFIGPGGGMEQGAMQKEGIPIRTIWTAKWRRYFSILNFIDLFKFPIACCQALWHLFVYMPDAVFSKGGAASVPVVLAARVYRIPVMLHDSDAVAGRANRFLARFATRIAIAYNFARKFFPPEKVALTGNPVRSEILAGSPERARQQYALKAEAPVILVVGGSLGARSLNEAVVRILPELLTKHYQILHVAGEKNYADTVRLAGSLGIKANHDGYLVFPFLSAEGMADAYAVADLVVARAGAGTIAEIAATRKPAILVPLASAANDEQRMNAYEVAENGGVLVLEEANIGPHILSSRIFDLMANADLRKSMTERVAEFYHPEAARTIARGMITMLSL